MIDSKQQHDELLEAVRQTVTAVVEKHMKEIEARCYERLDAYLAAQDKKKEASA